MVSLLLVFLEFVIRTLMNSNGFVGSSFRSWNSYTGSFFVLVSFFLSSVSLFSFLDFSFSNDFSFMFFVSVYSSFRHYRTFLTSYAKPFVIKRTMMSRFINFVKGAYSRSVLEPMTQHVRDYSYLTGKLKTPYYPKPGSFVKYYGIINEGDKVVIDSQNPEIWNNPSDGNDYQRVVILTNKQKTIDFTGKEIVNTKISDFGVNGKFLPNGQFANVYWILTTEVKLEFSLNKCIIDSNLICLAVNFLKTQRADSSTHHITSINV